MKNIHSFVIPSIDLLDGEIVRLYKGDYEQKTLYNIDIDELLEKYKDFQNLHIVDLNGAKGNGLVNIELIKKIRLKFKSRIQFGGGMRSIEIVNKALNEFNIDKFHLVGHDWGSAVGWYITSNFSDRIITWSALSVPHLDAFVYSMRNDSVQIKKSEYINYFNKPILPEIYFKICRNKYWSFFCWIINPL